MYSFSRRLCSGARLTTSLNLSQHLTSLKLANKLSAGRFFPMEYSIFPGSACASAWNENYMGNVKWAVL